MSNIKEPNPEIQLNNNEILSNVDIINWEGNFNIVTTDGKITVSAIANGDISVLTAGEAIAQYDFVILTDDGANNFRVFKANNSNVARIEYIGVALTSAVGVGDTLTVQHTGTVSNPGWAWALEGEPIWADGGANIGLGTQVQPTTIGNFIIPIGQAIAATTVLLNAAGSATVVEVTSASLPPPLQTVLTSGNATGGTDLVVTAGDSLVLNNSGFSGTLDVATLTAVRNYTLQDGSGVLAFLSDLPIFGTEYSYAEDDTVSITTSTTFQNKLTHITASVPAGTYRVSWSYQWNHDANTSDFEADIQVDASSVFFHKQEPKDNGGNFAGTGSAQQYSISGHKNLTFGTPGTHTVTIDYRTDAAGVNSAIWNVRLEFWRIS